MNKSIAKMLKDWLLDEGDSKIILLQGFRRKHKLM